jgi:hypothetical protein
VAHAIEDAPSGRAKCRGCGRAISKGELRLGERLPNPYTDKPTEGNAMVLWFHLACGAYKRPEVLLEALAGEDGARVASADAARLREIAAAGVAHPRLCRVDGADRAPSARARCRHCREPITKGTMRIRLVYYVEGRFEPAGFVHGACAGEYLGSGEVMERVRHFTPDLSADEASELAGTL